MLHEHVELFEGAAVEQQLDALARRELAPPMLRVDALLSAAKPRRIAPFFQSVDNVLHERRALNV